MNKVWSRLTCLLTFFHAEFIRVAVCGMSHGLWESATNSKEPMLALEPPLEASPFLEPPLEATVSFFICVGLPLSLMAKSVDVVPAPVAAEASCFALIAVALDGHGEWVM